MIIPHFSDKINTERIFLMKDTRQISVSRIISAILSIAVMVLIFLFSCEDADSSSDTSGFFTDIAIKIFFPDFSSFSADRQSEILGLLSHIVRKTAHFTIYASLGFCVSLTAGQRKLLSAGSAGSLFFCFLYAVSDEIHQYFVPGRACMIRDMLLDTAGALTGITASFIILGIIAHIAEKRGS